MDIKEFLNKPMLIFDMETQFSDLLDFIEFSEHNIEWQKRGQLQHLKRESKRLNLDGDEYFTKLQYIEYRYDINLVRKVRYGALIALVTSIQWITNSVKNRLTWEIKDTPKHVNYSVHIISEILNQYGDSVKHNLEKIEGVIKIRNCIAHSGGIVDGYKFQDEIECIVSNMDGFSISTEGIPSDVIDIEKGCVENIAIEIKTWLIPLINDCITKGIINLPDSH